MRCLKMELSWHDRGIMELLRLINGLIVVIIRLRELNYVKGGSGCEGI